MDEEIVDVYGRQVVAVVDDHGSAFGLYLQSGSSSEKGRTWLGNHYCRFAIPRGQYGPRLTGDDYLLWHREPHFVPEGAPCFLSLLFDLADRGRSALGGRFAWVQDEVYPPPDPDILASGPGVYAHPWMARLSLESAGQSQPFEIPPSADYVRVRQQT